MIGRADADDKTVVRYFIAKLAVQRVEKTKSAAIKIHAAPFYAESRADFFTSPCLTDRGIPFGMYSFGAAAVFAFALPFGAALCVNFAIIAPCFLNRAAPYGAALRFRFLRSTSERD